VSVHLHLDPIGGIAGDMFAAALLDAFPHLWDGLDAALRAAGLPAVVAVRRERHSDGVLAGVRFLVDDPVEQAALQQVPLKAPLLPAAAAHAAVAHVPFARIRAQVEGSGLPAGVVARALDIFTHLARAEAAVHGEDVETVAFHEVGSADSVADIVAAAWLLEGAGVVSASVSPLPLGSGMVRTAHGHLAVPAPAVVELLQGLQVRSDGRVGERVTPTGAAIVRHLLGPGGTNGSPPLRSTLVGSGTGFGTARFAGISNVVRALVFSLETAPSVSGDEVVRLAFEVDDQSGEELSVGLERLRHTDGVLDVLQLPAFGKKGRLTAAVRVLCVPAAEDQVVRACLLQTSTLGVRVERVRRVTLARDEGVRDGVNVKRVTRPDGTVTHKADIDDVTQHDTAAARAKARRQAEDDAS
jgi:uncharacterized protein (TIGR00299 family) protein